MKSHIFKTLPNGLRVFLLPYEAESVAVGFFIANGSRNESAKTAGISHFIEHMLFKGTPTRSPIDLSRTIERRGGNFNAYTTEEMTCYYAHLPYEYLADALDVLSDMYLNATIPQDEFEREKRVIIEEIKMYADEPDQVAAEALQQNLFPGSMLGAPVAGSERSLAPMTAALLRRYLHAHYRPSNTFVVIVGNFSVDDALREVSMRMGRFHRKVAANATLDNPFAKRVVHEETIGKKIHQTQMALGFRTFGCDDSRKYAATVMDAVLGRGMSSRLFQEVREKRGLSYDISSRMLFFNDAGTFTITAGMSQEKAAETLSVVESELRRICTKKISRAELQRTKDFLVGNFRLSHEKIISKMFYFGSTLLAFERYIDPGEQIEGIRSVTPDDLLATAKAIVQPCNRSLCWVVPKD